MKSTTARLQPILRLLLLLAILWAAPCPIRAAAAEARVYVILWFDTEDYLLPADDDATLRLTQMLSERGVRATFKIVGEKARVLEKRGRKDVIAGLKKHDIGYHSDFHSVHPTPSEYLAGCGLIEGIAEFTRRERKGAADVRRILGVNTLCCYGQPGSSWGAQAIAALPGIGVAPHGIPCYVDEGNHIGLDNKPFWYENALVVYHMGQNYTRMDLHEAGAVEPALKKVNVIADRLRAEGGGLISIFYHPCEWVHKEFWDGVNFARGANPPREQWKAPGQLPAAETEGAFQRFGQYIDGILKVQGVRFVTATDLPMLYPDPTRNGVSKQELAGLAKEILGRKGEVGFLAEGDKTFSAAEQFDLLCQALWESDRNVLTNLYPLKPRRLLGPAAEPTVPALGGIKSLGAAEFRAAVADTAPFLEKQGRIPSQVYVGSNPVAPADFLFAMAQAFLETESGGKLPDTIPLGQGTILAPAKQVAKDTPKVFGDWVIHKPGFQAPRILEIARLQTWTLKPATLKK